MKKYHLNFDEIKQFENNIKEDFSIYLAGKDFILTLSDDSIFLSIQNTPITLLVGYIKDDLIIPLYNQIQSIDLLLKSISANKNVSFKNILLVKNVKYKLTFETNGINKIQEYETPFIMHIFKFIENLE